MACQVCGFNPCISTSCPGHIEAAAVPLPWEEIQRRALEELQRMNARIDEIDARDAQRYEAQEVQRAEDKAKHKASMHQQMVDYFVGHVVQALIPLQYGGAHTYHLVASNAYDIAEALATERERRMKAAEQATPAAE